MSMRVRRLVRCLVVLATAAMTLVSPAAPAAASGGSAADGVPSASLRVMTWNVRQLDTEPSQAFWIALQIIRTKADVVGLQEVGEKNFRTIHQALEVLSRTRWQKHRADEFHTKKGGIAILTRLAAGGYTARTLESDANLLSKNRKLQRLDLTVGGERVVFYNTHLTNNSPDPATHWVDGVSRMRQAKHIRRLVAGDLAALGGDRKAVLAGDFNARPWHCSMGDMRAAGYADAWGSREPVSIPDGGCDDGWTRLRGGVADPDEPCAYDGDPQRPWYPECGFTIGTKFRTPKGVGPPYPRVRVDYVYTLPGVAVTHVMTPGSNGAELGVTRQAFDRVSDHFPVVATVSVPRSTAARYAAAVRADDPVSWWPLDETAGTTARDEAGPNHGDVGGGVRLGVPGPLGGGSTGFRFDGGACSGVDVGREPGSLAVPRLTVEAWARPDSPEGLIFRWRHHGYGFFVYFGSVYINGYPGGHPSEALGGSGLVDGRWHHVAGTWSGSAWQVYLDGALVGVSPPAAGDLYYNGSHAVAIGCDADACDGQVPSFDGDLAHVAVYDTALPESRVRAHFCAGRPEGPGCGT